MKKLILFLPFLLFISIKMGCTQELAVTEEATEMSSLKKGQIDINLGVGIIPLLDPSIAVDFALSDNFSIGAMAAYGGKYTIPNTKDFPQQLAAYSMGLRMMTHYTAFKKVDWYGGIMMGYKFNAQEIHKDLGSVFPGIFTCIFGSRVHINDHLGVYTELSYTGYSFVSMGVNFRL